MRRAGVVVVVLVLAAGCRRNMREDDAGPRTDAGSRVDAGRDAGPSIDAGVDAGVDGGGIPPEAESVLLAFIEGARVSASLGGPLSDQGQRLRRDCGLGDSCLGDTTEQTRLEEGIDGNSIVEPPGCASYTWMTEPLRATVTFTGCTVELTAQPLSGSVTVTLEFNPVRIGLTFAALTIGGDIFDGTVSLTINGNDTGPLTSSLDANLTYTSGGESVNFMLTGAEVRESLTTGAITVNGTATVTVGGTTTASVAMADLTWTVGNCLPTAGAATVTMPGVPTSTITFLATTPADGIVTVEVPPFPAGMQMLFMACP